MVSVQMTLNGERLPSKVSYCGAFVGVPECCADACCLLQVDTILSTLRLESAADTVVGNEFIRGVSGGEKRRLTLAEMLVRLSVALGCLLLTCS